MKMDGYYPLKMKRKDLEQVSDEFSDFSLSAPARKIRRLDAELPPILEEIEDDRDIPVAFVPSPSGQSFGGYGRRGVQIEELPDVPDNKETAIVLFKPMDTPFVLTPQNFSVKIDPQFISGLKNQVPWRSQSNQLGQDEDGAKEMGNTSAARNQCLAVVPWVPSQFPTQGSSQTDITDMMDAEELEEATMEVEDNGVSFRFLSLVVIITAGLVITSLRISRETIAPKLEDDLKFKKTPLSSCNFYSGKWVFDKDFSPLYSSRSCSFMDDGMACGKYGRSNLDYMFWKWQPHDCELPRFDAISLLEKLRNKRVVFVGDSLNRNQWVSLVCLIESSIPDESLKYVKFNGSLVTFEAIEYNAKIDFYWAPLLVESNCDDPSYHRVEDRIVRVDSIEKHARHWKDADVLVFNSYIWWRWLKMKVLRGSFESTNATYEDLGTLHTFELTLKTWSDWLDAHVNRTKTRVFFVSMSPTHSRAEEWGGRNGENCYNETEPISNLGYWGMDSDPDMMRLVEAAVHKLSSRGLNAEMLNITQLSEYRKEAHSSIYRKHWDPLTKEQLVNPGSYADCLHWCLPGVPDVWNQLLYVHLLYL